MAQEREPSWPAKAWGAVTDSSRAGWVEPLASLLVPGTGQLMAGADRGVVYLVFEGVLITGALNASAQAREAERYYRDLAWEVARRSFAPLRRDTTFEYYETMERFVESGAYDLDGGPGFVPEQDLQTYNGTVWRLARETYFANPDSTPDPSSEAYQRALGFYRQHAVGPDFRWSWRDAGLEQDLYRQTIQESDDAYRSASMYLGVLIANHLAASLDAYVSRRLSADARRPVSVRSGLSWGRVSVAVAVAF